MYDDARFKPHDPYAGKTLAEKTAYDEQVERHQDLEAQAAAKEKILRETAEVALTLLRTRLAEKAPYALLDSQLTDYSIAHNGSGERDITYKPIDMTDAITVIAQDFEEFTREIDPNAAFEGCA